jgi:hypothetical protein
VFVIFILGDFFGGGIKIRYILITRKTKRKRGKKKESEINKK